MFVFCLLQYDKFELSCLILLSIFCKLAFARFRSVCKLDSLALRLFFFDLSVLHTLFKLFWVFAVSLLKTSVILLLLILLATTIPLKFVAAWFVLLTTTESLLFKLPSLWRTAFKPSIAAWLSLISLLNQICTLMDLEYGEKSENHGKWEIHALGR